MNSPPARTKRKAPDAAQTRSSSHQQAVSQGRTASVNGSLARDSVCDSCASPSLRSQVDAIVGDDEESFRRRHNVRMVGAGKRVLFLSHGFGTNQQVWRGVLDHLDTEHEWRVVLWDLVGAFSTDPENFDFRRYASLHSYADDLLELLDEMGLEHVVFVGHSVSGMIGLLACVEKPAAFESLILLGSSPRYLNEPASGYIGGFEPQDLEQVFSSMRANYVTWASGYAPLMVGQDMESSAVRQFTETLFRVRPDIALCSLRTAFQSDYRHVLRMITRPVHLLQTLADPAVPTSTSQYLQRHIRHACLEILPVHGHLPHLTHPQAVVDAINAHARPGGECIGQQKIAKPDGTVEIDGKAATDGAVENGGAVETGGEVGKEEEVGMDGTGEVPGAVELAASEHTTDVLAPDISATVETEELNGTDQTENNAGDAVAAAGTDGDADAVTDAAADATDGREDCKSVGSTRRQRLEDEVCAVAEVQE
eukprot:TRINITY_DN24745_c0_g2_i1.p1 TRINITY_DN24745_c0_g2~~TRINITY_DN24745_c0_g2_i1.p1  ORF type:complete len:481 (-),score=17.74 TRINITY_DN24745_c0_g2_i1:322-1764(-)